MKHYPVGSVCVIVQSGKVTKEFVGLECTIVEGLAVRNSTLPEGGVAEIECYVITVQGRGDRPFHAPPHSLKLKRYPGQLGQWATDKVKELFKPNNKFVEDFV